MDIDILKLLSNGDVRAIYPHKNDVTSKETDLFLRDIVKAIEPYFEKGVAGAVATVKFDREGIYYVNFSFGDESIDKCKCGRSCKCHSRSDSEDNRDRIKSKDPKVGKV